MLGTHLISRSEVIQVDQDDMSEILEGICHCTLKSIPGFFEVEGHKLIGKGASSGCEGSFVLMFLLDVDLVCYWTNQ